MSVEEESGSQMPSKDADTQVGRIITLAADYARDLLRSIVRFGLAAGAIGLSLWFLLLTVGRDILNTRAQVELVEWAVQFSRPGQPLRLQYVQDAARAVVRERYIYSSKPFEEY